VSGLLVRRQLLPKFAPRSGSGQRAAGWGVVPPLLPNEQLAKNIFAKTAKNP
jgi:hypothetical protein